jgi:4-aminobutyrate aminotransferase
MALTGKVHPYKLAFGPFPPEIYHAPFPSALHGVTVQASLDAIEMLFKADIDPRRVAAIIIEPVQGEGGFNVAPFEFLRALRALCDRHGIVLIADEVQSGFGRTGKMFGIEHSGVQPDMITMAKSLAGGMPLSGVCGRAALMDAPAPGGLGGTYAGNPLALASALAVLDIMESEALIERAGILGGRLRAALGALQAHTPEIAEIRGLGAMVAVEFQHPGDGSPHPEFARKVQRHAMDNGLLLLTCGVHGNVIRFLFPLTIEDATLSEGLQLLANAIRS